MRGARARGRTDTRREVHHHTLMKAARGKPMTDRSPVLFPAERVLDVGQQGAAAAIVVVVRRCFV